MRINHLHKHISITLSILLLSASTLLADKVNTSEENKKLETITIISDNSSNYLNTKKTKIGRNNIETEKMANSVQVFNKDFISDFQTNTVDDLITMSSNTVYQGHGRSRNNSYSMRGFEGVSLLRDGLRVEKGIPDPEVFDLESIEVLKGPNSIQFGESQPGGIINLVKKKPQKEFHAEIKLDINSNALFSPKLDIGGPLSENGKLRYRLITTYKNDPGYKNYSNNNKKLFIAPSLAYDLNENNTLTLIAEISDEEKPFDFGSILSKDGGIEVSLKNTITHPAEIADRDQKILGFDFDSTFNNWNSNFKYRNVNYTLDLPKSLAVMAYNYDTNQIKHIYTQQNQDYTENILQYTINSDFKIANIENNLTIGLDYRKQNFKQFTAVDWASAYYLDLKNPKYKLPYPETPNNLTSFGPGVNGVFKTTRYGGFIQDHINASENLIFSAGLRYEKVKYIDEPTPSSSYTSTKVLPQFGIVYKINQETSIFTNYSESFNPQQSWYKDGSGKILKPETGKGYEIGLKQKLLDDNLSFTTSIFKIEKENVAMLNNNTANPRDYIASAKRQSQGIEFDLNGELSPGWSIVASYGYTKTKDNKNKEFNGVPKHTANVFTTYKLNNPTFSNVYIGAGAEYLGKKTVSARGLNDITIKAHTIYNASISYKKASWEANLSVKNLFNKEYVRAASTNIGVAEGSPRTLNASLSYKF